MTTVNNRNRIFYGTTQRLTKSTQPLSLLGELSIFKKIFFGGAVVGDVGGGIDWRRGAVVPVWRSGARARHATTICGSGIGISAFWIGRAAQRRCAAATEIARAAARCRQRHRVLIRDSRLGTPAARTPPTAASADDRYRSWSTLFRTYSRRALAAASVCVISGCVRACFWSFVRLPMTAIVLSLVSTLFDRCRK